LSSATKREINQLTDAIADENLFGRDAEHAALLLPA